LRDLVIHRPQPRAAREMAERFTFGSLVPQYESLFRRVAGVGLRT
jgi:hypothetical protein